MGNPQDVLATLATFSSPLAEAKPLGHKDFSNFSSFSTGECPALKLWTEDICKQLITVYGYDKDLWRVFWNLAEEEKYEDVRRVEALLEGTRKNMLLQFFFDRFVNRTDYWFRQWRYNDEFGYKRVPEEGKDRPPLSIEDLRLHILGKVTLSLPAVSPDFMCKWCCFDSDKEEGSGLIERIESLLRTYGFYPVLEGGRPGREGHVWLLFDRPVQASDLLLLKKQVYAQLDIEGIDRKNLDFFPFSSTKVSQARLPLGKHLKPSANGHVSTFKGAKGGQLTWLIQQPLNAAEGVERLASVLRLQEEEPKPKKVGYVCRNKDDRKEPYSILPFFGNLKRRGSDFATACPLCKAEGGDTHEDNLRISADGLRMNCVAGGPNAIHKSADLYRHFGF